MNVKNLLLMITSNLFSGVIYISIVFVIIFAINKIFSYQIAFSIISKNYDERAKKKLRFYLQNFRHGYLRDIQTTFRLRDKQDDFSVNTKEFIKDIINNGSRKFMLIIEGEKKIVPFLIFSYCKKNGGIRKRTIEDCGILHINLKSIITFKNIENKIDSFKDKDKNILIIEGFSNEKDCTVTNITLKDFYSIEHKIRQFFQVLILGAEPLNNDCIETYKEKLYFSEGLQGNEREVGIVIKYIVWNI